MPTYQNRSGAMVSVGDFSFSAGEKKPIHQKYLDITDHPTIIKISEEPVIDNQFITVFENISASSALSMSRLFNFQHSTILKVIDGTTPPSIGTTVEIGCFAGITDDVTESILVKRFKFTRRSGFDQSGNAFYFWEADSFPKVIQQQIDVYSELITFLVLSAPANGSIDLMIKYY